MPAAVARNAGCCSTRSLPLNLQGKHVVGPNWLWCCAYTWQRADESMFPVKSGGGTAAAAAPQSEAEDVAQALAAAGGGDGSGGGSSGEASAPASAEEEEEQQQPNGQAPP